jgi:pimeloyl-ACP methyl ester carboxylesterase
VRGFVLVLALALSLSACFAPKAVSPMPIDTFGSVDGNHMVIMFPGYGDRASTFRERDFFSVAEDHEKAFGEALFVATDAHLGYYLDKSLPERIEQDVLQQFPDRDRLTLLGVSMGGMGASLIASMHTEKVDRVILFAPYLGGKRFLKRIRNDDFETRKRDSLRVQGLLKAWRFLVKDAAETGAEVVVLYGESDRLSDGIELLAAKAPHVRMISREGGHGWATWTPLWNTYLAEQKAAVGVP